MSEKLKPCPFCGGKARLRSYRSCDCCGMPYNGMVMCSVEECSAEVSHFETDEEAIAAWNRRAPLPSQEAGE